MTSVIFFIFMCFGGIVFSDLPEPYNHAMILPYTPKGWYGNGAQLEALIKIKRVETIIEVGSWLGKSTMHMASCLPQHGKVYAVDHWMGSVEHQPGMSAWSPEVFMLYEYFLSNVIQAGLAHKIIPIRMESLEAAKQLKVTADLIYIDAAHDTASVYADLVAWYPHVKKGGIFCGDDWTWPTVRKAVEIFAKERNLHINAAGNFWQLL
jgi:predicted O-methyltransferase YrrM